MSGTNDRRVGRELSEGWLRRVGRELAVFGLLLAVAVAGRLMPHPPNFTPIAGAALLAGFAMRSRLLAAVLPIAAMAASDYVVGFYKLPIMIVVYASFCLPVLFGRRLPRRFAPVRLAGCSLAASVIFFLTTNTAVWAFGSLYAKDWSGLMESYAAGVPFFGYTVLGDLVWSFGLFGTYAVLRLLAGSRGLVASRRVEVIGA